MINKGPYTLRVFDAGGEEIMNCEVAIGIPKTIGWNLSLERGRTGLATEILVAIGEHEFGILPDA